jgi:regulator of protease activity HflC (stomatin/prohibitin superfamily)
VRFNIDFLLTFSITDPYKFIFNISADDFDKVLQASCQDAVRTRIRSLTIEEVVKLQRKDTQDLQSTISQDVEPYGVTVHHIVVTFARPPVEFIQSQEARQLAVVQQAAEEEQQRLALQRQKNNAELAQQKVLSDAATETLRLEQLQEQLKDFPAAAQYDLQRARMQVAQALAGNTRAMLQVGRVDDIAQALIMRDALQDWESTAAGSDSDISQNKAAIDTKQNK